MNSSSESGSDIALMPSVERDLLCSEDDIQERTNLEAHFDRAKEKIDTLMDVGIYILGENYKSEVRRHTKTILANLLEHSYRFFNNQINERSSEERQIFPRLLEMIQRSQEESMEGENYIAYLENTIREMQVKISALENRIGNLTGELDLQAINHQVAINDVTTALRNRNS